MFGSPRGCDIRACEWGFREDDDDRGVECAKDTLLSRLACTCMPACPSSLKASSERFESCMGFAFLLHLQFNIHHCRFIELLEAYFSNAPAYSKLRVRVRRSSGDSSWATPQFSWAINQEGGGAEGDAAERESEKGNEYPSEGMSCRAVADAICAPWCMTPTPPSPDPRDDFELMDHSALG